MENTMTTANKTKASNDIARKIARALYPEYRGRKIKVVSRKSYTMQNYWDGGSRVYVKAVNLDSGLVSDPSAATESPFNPEAGASFEIPAGVALVEHSYFCGTDMGITIVIGQASQSVPALAEMVRGLLPAVAA